VESGKKNKERCGREGRRESDLREYWSFDREREVAVMDLSRESESSPLAFDFFILI
jgi:hypothetical protein